MAKASTAYVERSNLNVRHMNGRMRTAAMQAGITDHVWTASEFIATPGHRRIV